MKQRLGIGIVALLALPMVAQAAVLVPPIDATMATSDNGAAVGTLVTSTGALGLTDTSLSGSVTTTTWAAVYMNASGFLDFYYQVRNDSAQQVVDRITHTSFVDNGGLVDVYYRTDGNLINPIFTAGGLAPCNGPGCASNNTAYVIGTVGFAFRDPALGGAIGNLGPGEVTSVMVIKTNATEWTGGFTQGIDGGVTEVVTFAPSAPEPATLALLGLAFIGAGLRHRRK
jgi:hypothetical protein